MIKVMFICHGNICRSPMAEFLFKDLLLKEGITQFKVNSSATSYDAIGEHVHYETCRILNNLGIDCSKKKAVHLSKEDFDKYDYFIGMDQDNVYNIRKILTTTEKVYKLLDFTNKKTDVKDPWYTGNFRETYEDIMLGIKGLYEYIIKN